MEKVNVDGINIAYVRRGTGPSLVLIHGYPLDHSIWDEVLPLLEDSFDLIVPDLRGFGESDLIEADDSIIGYATDIVGLLTQLRVQRAFLAGHSMGGYVALAFAREFPNRVSGLALVSSQAQGDSPERKQGRYAGAQQVMEQGVEMVADAMAPKLSVNSRVQKYAHDLISRQRPPGLASALKAMAERPDSTDLLSGFDFPLVALHGDADVLIPIERAREMKAGLPTTHLVELAGLGHLPMMENPEAVAETLRFLKNS